MPEPEGANCPAGGVAIRSGLDHNGNDELDGDEITQTEYVCSAPALPRQPATHVREEAPGEDCAHGGVAIDTGIDRDGDGALTGDEISRTEYVCNVSAPTRPTMALVRDEPPGEACSNGGVAIETGVDLDDDGALAGEEITRTEFVCNAAEPTRPTMAQVRDEAPGEACSHGGVAVESGVDFDDDGLLSGEEITRTEYVCNAPVHPRARTVQVREEPPGEACFRGGVAIEVGVDQNDDGELSGDEIEQVQHVCHETGIEMVWSGDYTIKDQASYDALQGMEIIDGDLTIMWGAPENIELPYLRQENNRLIFYSNTPQTRVVLPALRSVGSEVHFDGPFNTVSLPALQSGTVFMIYYATLDELLLPKMTAVEIIEIMESSIHSLDLTSLASAEYFEFESSTGPTTLELPSLREITHTFDISDVGQVEDVRLPLLERAQYFDVMYNFSLRSLDAPALAFANAYNISYNPLLPTCQATAIANALTANGASGIVTSNGLGTCE